MKRTAFRTSLATALALALGLGGGAIADATDAKGPVHIHIAELSKKTQKILRRAGVAGPTLDLLGTPLAGLSLYQARWSKGGECVSGVNAGKVDGADCDPEMFTATQPGYATAGSLGSTNTGTAKPGQVPPHKLTILQVYGAATKAITSVRLIGPTSGTTRLPIVDGTPGFMLFGSASPPKDGDFVELLNATGKIVQRIQIAP